MRSRHIRGWYLSFGTVAALGLAALGISLDLDDRLARDAARTQGTALANLDHDPTRAVSLAKVRATGIVPPSFAETITVNLDILPVDEKKATFFKILLPLVARENGRIRRERRHLLDDPDHVPEYIWEKYDVAVGDMATLRRRVDVIPASLVLAQAALESGWGTSRFALKANNLFGIRSYNPDTPGLEPEEADGFKVIKYANLTESVAHYMLNLNTHEAYKELRQVRATMRAHEEDPDSRQLSKRLTQYSEIPNKYGDLLHQIIDGDHLEEFDGVRLSNEG